MPPSLDRSPPALAPPLREVVGTSTEGRPIYLESLPAAPGGPRILLIGGQHGDEPLARAAVSGFLPRWRAEKMAAGVQLAAIPDLNPDGRAAGTRTNAAGIDLNRDHQRLRGAETQALHQLVRRWQPQLIVDVHTYPPRRKHLLRQGWTYAHDLFLDLPNNPSLLPGVADKRLTTGMQGVLDRLGEDGFLADRYLLVRRSGRVRHSTADAVDARNHLALRYGIPVILVEGKQPPRRTTEAAGWRTQQAVIRTLHHIVAWSIEYLGQPRDRTEQDPAPRRVALRCRYQPATAPAHLRLEQVDSGQLCDVVLPGPYTPSLRPTSYVSLPDAYAVPKALSRVVQLLAAHGWRGQPLGPQRSAPGPGLAQQYQIQNCVPSRRPHRAARQVQLATHPYPGSLDDYLLYPTAAAGGRCLAVLLEPHSKYGLARYDEYGLSLRPGQDYPVLRWNA
ncbi:MAG: hypothetical protein GTO26_02630 [Planctomycetales bacterium]|nr:hypothetical protein [Planctomycetales bacterium]NIO33890.1 hypothetical protein [Planctomycetales bacterium]NIO45698.1 hypothetical protein [Planctomycetales bacterium]NIP84536.1 hypothetical protein [Planctomycetales bacterium]